MDNGQRLVSFASDEIADYLRQIAAIKADAAALVRGINDEQFNRQPEPGRWSAGQCLEHLNITHRAMLHRMQQAAERTRAGGRRARGPTRHGWVMRWLINSMEPPPKRRYRTGTAFVPPEHLSRDPVLTEFTRLHDDLLRLLEQLDGCDLGAEKVPSPFARWLRYKLGSAMALQLAHDRRHLWQARAAVAASWPGAAGRRNAG